MSRPRVTITLGQTGQVVKRSSQVAEMSVSGRKRSIMERLGSCSGSGGGEGLGRDGNDLMRKRQRGLDDKRNHSDEDANDDKGARVDQNDLRVKLMHKRMSKRQGAGGSGQRKMDLREKLSPVHMSVQSEPYGSRSTSAIRLIPSARSSDHRMEMNSFNRSPEVIKVPRSQWTMDDLRRKSPERNLSTSSALSPPRNSNELRRIHSMRPVEMSRPVEVSRSTAYISNRSVEVPRSIAYTTKEVMDSSRHASLMMQPTTPHEVVKPIMQQHLPSSNGSIQNTSYAGQVPLTVASLLNSLGLGKYEITFRAEEVDMTALRQMGDQDLKELGIPMGPRKKILLAILPRARRQQP